MSIERKVTLLVLFFQIAICFKATAFQQLNKRVQHVDSSLLYVDSNPELARIYFDSIGTPSEEILKNRIAAYYYVKAKLEAEDYNPSSSFYYFKRSLSLAQEHKESEIAAKAASHLASQLYLLKKDSLANEYYQKAFAIYKELDDQAGLLDLMQFPAYAKYVNDEMEASIALLLDELETYRTVKGDNMYYSFALFLLTSNYLHLEDLENAQKYYSIYRSLEGDTYIEPSYYDNYNNAIKSCFADYFLEKKVLDSTKFYLDRITIKSGSRDINTQRDLYSNFAKYYQLKGEEEKANVYLDSLSSLENRIADRSIETSVRISEDLTRAQMQLNEVEGDQQKKTIWIYVLVVGLVILIPISFFYVKKSKNKDSKLSRIQQSFFREKVKQEKLAVKNIELEELFALLRKEIKAIAAIESNSEQKKRISQLYREINVNHSGRIDNEEHYKLISTINEEFFEKAKTKFPQLDSLDILICYYIYTGFKNKEIAGFVNRSIRAIENKRYRISKKLNLQKSGEVLSDFLQRTFQQ
ncbi:MAG: LuxR family transcriptional regulator [Flavobacteriales bacterium]|jgi:hypothetical protein|nr:LuxR family transcriptional regulator [Flavobacteriales bacterium]